MPEHKIEEDAEGNLSYRGWPLEIIPCGSQFLKVPKGACICGQPMYLGYSPYEATLEDWNRLWPVGITYGRLQPRYEGYYACRHVAGGGGSEGSLSYIPTIQAVIDFLEELLEQARKKTWEEVANASQVP